MHKKHAPIRAEQAPHTCGLCFVLSTINKEQDLKSKSGNFYGLNIKAQNEHSIHMSNGFALQFTHMAKSSPHNHATQ